jgi:2-keto-4-pentenoate hydratase/2-oxohepta-3-ene-1,7-dioic acid hydratase in catechol pathway
MRLATFLQGGAPSLGVVDAVGFIEPIPTDHGEPTTMRGLIERWESMRSSLEDLVEISTPARRSMDRVRLLAPLADPGKIVAVGLNYVDHAAESGQVLPTAPLVFTKFSSSIIGPGEAITWDPALTQAVDFEAELAVVIGRQARNVTEADALSYVFGYTCLNDVSARDLQFGDGQWVRGKSLDTFCPMGPIIVTADEIPDPQALGIGCRIGDVTMQEASTQDMIFGVAELVATLSRSFTLEPGDVIATGTPPGVGYFRDPKRLLADGDEVTVWVESIGDLRNPCRASATP